MKTIIVDGKKFVEEYNGPIKIVVLERGFVYVGRVEMNDTEITIYNARSLIQWGTTNHLGELVNGPTPKTKLGNSCNVRSFIQQVIHTIEVNQDAWYKYID